MSAHEAYGQDCSRAGARGAAPSSWQTYCWLNMSNYSDTQARSTGGQSLSYNLPDGSRLTFRLRVTNTPTNGSPYLTSVTAPSWGGAAVGNSSFLNIPGRPILYQNINGSQTTLTFTNITVIPPAGVSQANQYAFVVADAESTDNNETQQYTTNGASWQLLDRVAPISGAQYPTATGLGSTTFRSAGGGRTGNVGAYIVGSLNPTSVTVTMQGSGLQGVMLAIRFASITLSKQVEGTRIADNDQFRFLIESSTGSVVYASGQTDGTDRGPFPAAVFSSTSGVPLVLREEMVSGSSSTLADYRATLTCTNINSGSTTVLPRDTVTNRYDFGKLQFGDFVDCVFTNTPNPKLELRTVIASPGRIFTNDQFRLDVRNQDANSQIAAFVTTGAGTTATPSTTGRLAAIAGATYRLTEVASGTTTLQRYSPTLACTNRNSSSSTVLPAGGATGLVVPRLGDVITCTITNTRNSPRAIVSVDKTSRVISDPTQSASPKAIPGAIVEYTIRVTNSGDAASDANTLRLIDTPDTALAYYTAFPAVFTDGATASGLTFNPGSNVAFSNQTTGPGFTYAPASPSDPAVARIRFSPTGSLRASNGIAHPSFTLQYRVVIE
ncbi:CshA/CshB family fibrillar adhesin-related protein [Qipengyuania sp. 483]